MFGILSVWLNDISQNIFGALAVFAVGLVMLIKGGDWFVDSASNIAKRFRVPEIIIGATVVSIGTTLPEVMVSTISALDGAGSIAYGNAIGSIICNTALIAALTVAIRPAPVNRKAIVMPVIFFFASAAIYMVCAYLFQYFYWWMGLIMLVVFAGYMVLTVRQGFTNPEKAETEENEGPKGSLAKDLLVLVGSAALIAIGAEFMKTSAVSLATMAHIPETVIGVTVVALCTSLPELVTAITALAKGHGALSLGNIIGANIFNLVLVSGVAVTLAPFPVPNESQIFGANASLVMEIPLMVGVMAILTLPALLRGKLSRIQGFCLLVIYVAFIAVQVLIATGVL